LECILNPTHNLYKFPGHTSEESLYLIRIIGYSAEGLSYPSPGQWESEEHLGYARASPPLPGALGIQRQTELGTS
jgi:hypothetical protein